VDYLQEMTDKINQKKDHHYFDAVKAQLGSSASGGRNEQALILDIESSSYKYHGNIRHSDGGYTRRLGGLSLEMLREFCTKTLEYLATFEEQSILYHHISDIKFVYLNLTFPVTEALNCTFIRESNWNHKVTQKTLLSEFLYEFFNTELTKLGINLLRTNLNNGISAVVDFKYGTNTWNASSINISVIADNTGQLEDATEKILEKIKLIDAGIKVETYYSWKQDGITLITN
jgi:hypothetical protein